MLDDWIGTFTGTPWAISWIRWTTWLAAAVVVGLGGRCVVELWQVARRERALAGAVVGISGVAWTLRVLAPPSQADLYFRLEQAMDPLQGSGIPYGYVAPSLVRPLFQLGGSESWVIGLDLLLGGLTVVAVVALGRRLGLDRLQSSIAGLILAVHPLHVRLSATDWPGIPETLLTAWGLALFLDPARRPWTSWGAGVILGLAAGLRPESIFVPVAAAGLAAATGTGGLPLGRALLAGTAVYLPQALETADRVLADPALVPALGAPAWGDLLAVDPVWTSVVVIVALPFALFVGPVRPGVRIWLLGMLVLASVWVPYGTSELLLAGARHQVRMLPFLALAAAAPLGWLLDRLPAARPRIAVGAGLLGMGLYPLPSAYWRASLHDELSFARQALPDLPAGCHMLAFRSPGRDLALHPPRHLAPQLDWHIVDRGAPLGIGGTSCALYYRGANCYASPPREVDLQLAGRDLPVEAGCARFEALHELEPVAVRDVPARRFSTDFYPPGSRFEVGVYVLDGLDEPPEAPSAVPPPPPPVPRPTSLPPGAHARLEASRLLASLPEAEPVELPDLQAAIVTADLPGICQGEPRLSCDDVSCLVIVVSDVCTADVAAAALGDALEPDTLDLSYSRPLEDGAVLVLAPIPLARAADRALLERISARAEAELELQTAAPDPELPDEP